MISPGAGGVAQVDAAFAQPLDDGRVGRTAVTLLLQADRPFAQDLDFAFEARVFHVEVQRREHDGDAQEEHARDREHVGVIFRYAFAYEDRAREKLPEGAGPAAALPAFALLGFGLFCCLAFQVGADLLLGLAPFDAQYLAPHAAGKFRFLCALRLLFGGYGVEFVVGIHGRVIVLRRRAASPSATGGCVPVLRPRGRPPCA